MAENPVVTADSRLETNTASAEEVAQFSARADAWWDTEGDFAPLHKFNPPRLEFIRDTLCARFDRDFRSPRPLEGLRLLDIGCGGGLLSEPMTRLGATVLGIDAAEKNVGTAIAHARSMGLEITYRTARPEELAAEGAEFDAVINMEVIEHVPDPGQFVTECARLVAPGGVMVLGTLNRTLKALALAKVGAEYVLRWLPAGTHDWRKFVRPSELATYLRHAGLDLTNMKGTGYHLMTDEWRLTDDLDVNYLAVAVKPEAD